MENFSLNLSSYHKDFKNALNKYRTPKEQEHILNFVLRDNRKIKAFGKRKEIIVKNIAKTKAVVSYLLSVDSVERLQLISKAYWL